MTQPEPLPQLVLTHPVSQPNLPQDGRVNEEILRLQTLRLGPQGATKEEQDTLPILQGSDEPEKYNMSQAGFLNVLMQVALVKNLPKRHKRRGLDPWVRKIPWRRAWQSTPVFLPGESHGQRSLVGYNP